MTEHLLGLMSDNETAVPHILIHDFFFKKRPPLLSTSIGTTGTLTTALTVNSTTTALTINAMVGTLAVGPPASRLLAPRCNLNPAYGTPSSKSCPTSH